MVGLGAFRVPHVLRVHSHVITPLLLSTGVRQIKVVKALHNVLATLCPEEVAERALIAQRQVSKAMMLLTVLYGGSLSTLQCILRTR